MPLRGLGTPGLASAGLGPWRAFGVDLPGPIPLAPGARGAASELRSRMDGAPAASRGEMEFI